MKIGDRMIYVDSFSVEHNALITNVFDWPDATQEMKRYKGEYAPSLNVVYVSGNESETDGYGRQTKHDASLPHRTNTPAHGRYWVTVDDAERNS